MSTSLRTNPRIRFAAPWLAACIAAIPAAALIASAPGVYAQGAQTGLREAVEAAWARQPQAAAKEARADEFAARDAAAGALLPGAPVFSVDHSTDALNRNDGRRAFGGEFSVPLWLPGQQDRARGVVAADRTLYDGTTLAMRLRIAGEVRDAYWQARADAAEVALAQSALDAALALASDVQRRVRSGELARIDGNRAEVDAQTQRLTLAESESRAHRSLQAFRALTGLSRLPQGDEPTAAARPPLEAHPASSAAAQVVEAAQARLRQTAGDTRDAPEIGIGTARERADMVKPWEQIVTLRLRIPLAYEHRNRPRIAAASAELVEAQSGRALIAARIEAEAVAAARDYEAAQSAMPVAERRLDLARDTRTLIARGFAAGEFDLPARLRAELELRDAELARARAQLAAGRANSRLKQAYGVMP